ncbi:MAG TPA: hypothetical protein P5572_02595 [Phycisphaerae bacterium]|nr:hypothetical protein [Phycisphaerae bacterium]
MIARGECAVLHDTLDSAAAITSAGGDISGTLTFAPGVNANAVVFGGGAEVQYSSPRLAAPAGSISFWIRRNGTSTQGGIAEIGVLGTSNSLGLFYFDSTHLVFEMRNDASIHTAIWGTDALSSVQWRHVVATWRDAAGGTDLWLFLDGQYVGYAFLEGASNRTALTLRLGATGYYGGGEVLVDELRFFDWNLHDGEVYAEYVVSANRHRPQPSSQPVSTGPVRIVDGRLDVEGRPFTVRGACYSPLPIGVGPTSAAAQQMYGDPAVIARDLPLLHGLHANTIRTYIPPPDTALLDALYNGGTDPIYAILGFWIPWDGVDFSNPASTAPIEADFVAFVNRFKDHPGLLAWGLGNEVNINISAGQRPYFFVFCDRLAQIAHALEGAAYHPTVIVNAFNVYAGTMDEWSDDVSLPNVDMWGQNLYAGWDPHCYYAYWRQISAKPLLVTEFGIDAWDNAHNQEYPATQAAYDVRQWRYIEQNALGGTVFEYCDEWWKDTSPTTHDFGGYGTHWHPDGYSNEEWWGLLAVSDNGAGPDIATPRQAYFDLAVEYAHAPGDYDADGDVDLADFAAFQRCLGQPAEGACGSAFEFRVDGVIATTDLPGVVGYLAGPASN